MAYSEKLIDHYEHPRNVGSLDKDAPDVGTGLVGAPACGDVMKLQIRVNDRGIIEDAKFKTFGCGSAIASSSLVTEWVKGKTIDEALTIKNTDVAHELNLPPVKIHCSVLAEDAIRAAVADYQKKHVAAPAAGGRPLPRGRASSSPGSEEGHGHDRDQRQGRRADPRDVGGEGDARGRPPPRREGRRLLGAQLLRRLGAGAREARSDRRARRRARVRRPEERRVPPGDDGRLAADAHADLVRVPE